MKLTFIALALFTQARHSWAAKAPALRDVRCNPRVNSDTSHMAGNRHAEEKYEHTNRKGSKKTPVWVPC